MAGILVCTEVADGKLARSGLELLGGMRKVADDLGVPLNACLVGSDVVGLAQELINYGADNVIIGEQALLSDFNSEYCLSAIEQVCKTEKPKLVVLNGNTIGAQIAPRLAYRLHAGIVTGCIDITVSPEEKEILMHKPVYGGKAIAIMAAREQQVVTIRPKVMKMQENDPSRTGCVNSVLIELSDKLVKTKLLDRVMEQVTGVKIEDAKIVVSGGRGIGGTEGFKQLEELAGLINGAVGASRAAVDSGWVVPSRQVGLTGKIVSPDLYIAVGVSGALQHVAGMSGSKNVIAINKDPEAPILRIAKLAVIDDYRKIIPLLTEKIKEIV